MNRRKVKRYATAGATVVGVSYLAYCGYEKLNYQTNDVNCIKGTTEWVNEGQVDIGHLTSDFKVTTAKGDVVARIVVAASVDKSMPIKGLQVLLGKPIPAAQAEGSAVVTKLSAETAMINPADVTGFGFVDGLGQTAVTSIDGHNQVQIVATADGNKTDVVNLKARCVTDG